MTISTNDLKLFKSATVTNGNSNGGRAGTDEIISGVRHAVFPRVTEEQRTAGETIHRKIFPANYDATDALAYESLDFISFPSSAGDRYYLGEGTQIDTQADIIATPPTWVGCGQLNTALVGGESSIDLLMPHNDYAFIAGGKLFLSSMYRIGQTVDGGVPVGGSVTFSGGTWSSVASSTDVIYPNGIYLGSNAVMSYESGVAHSEYLTIASASPYAYSGNVATVQLNGTVSNVYAVNNTYGAQCIRSEYIRTFYDTFSLTSAAGTYDNTTYPPVLFNRGTVEDTITITMTSSTNFSCSGLYEGSMGTGAIGTDFSPTNAATGVSYFTLRAAGWGGTLANGDILTFKTHPAKISRWLKEVVPAGTAAANDNLFIYSNRVE